jgi:hypothetical protein
LIFQRKILRRILGHTIQPDGTRSRKSNEELNNAIKKKCSEIIKRKNSLG